MPDNATRTNIRELSCCNSSIAADSPEMAALDALQQRVKHIPANITPISSTGIESRF